MNLNTLWDQPHSYVCYDYHEHEPAAGQRIRDVSLIVMSVRSEGYTVDSTKQIVSVRTILFSRVDRTLFSISEPTSSCYYYKLAY